MTPEIVAAPGDAEREAILAALVAYNNSQVPPGERHPVAIVLRDDAGAVNGGLWGNAGYGWLFVQYLVVPAAARGRGQGRALMVAAEAEARRLGCTGGRTVPFTLQARGCYAKYR